MSWVSCFASLVPLALANQHREVKLSFKHVQHHFAKGVASGV